MPIAVTSNLPRIVRSVMPPPINPPRLSRLALSLAQSANRPSTLKTGLTQKNCFSIGNSLLRRIRINLKKDSAQSVDKKLYTLITRQTIRNTNLNEAIASQDYKTMAKLVKKSSARGKQLHKAITNTGINHRYQERLVGLYQQPYKIIETYFITCDILRGPEVNQIKALKELIAISNNQDAIDWAFKNHRQICSLSEELETFIAEQQAAWESLATMDACIENHALTYDPQG